MKNLKVFVIFCGRNLRMRTVMSTMQTCPPWPHRLPRALRTSTSCRSLRCPCRPLSSRHDP
ncbi:hypothetical protein AMECASPLE_029203, partial [Ameca splendens]